MTTPTMTSADGKVYKLVVLKVTSKDALGRPLTTIVGYDDTTFDLKGGEEFWTAWVPAEMVDVDTKARA